MKDIIKHDAYSHILEKKKIDKPLLPLVEMELTGQEIDDLKKDILELDKVNHLETCGREIAMCFAYWFQYEYCGGRETKKAEEVAEYIGLDKAKSKFIVDYGLNALKAWGVKVSISNEGKQRKVGTLLEQGGTPINYVLQLVKNKEKGKQEKASRLTIGKKNTEDTNKERETEQTRVNYLGFLTSLLREAPNYSSDWDKALENAKDIVSLVEASDYIPESLKTPYLCRKYLLIIRGIVEDNATLLESLDKGMKDLVDKLRQIYYETNKEVKDLALRWKVMIEHGQILQYYSLVNHNLIDPEKFDFETNNCNSLDLIVGNNRFHYMKDKVNGKLVYRYRPQAIEKLEVYYDGIQPYVQAQILLGGHFHTVRLKNDTPINFATPQVLKESSGFYTPNFSISDPSNVIVFNNEWHCEGADSKTVSYNNEEYHLIRFNNNVQLINANGEPFKTRSINTDYNIEIQGAEFEYIDCQKYILTQNGPIICVYDINGNNVIDECKIVYRIHQSYNGKWMTMEEWGELPLGVIDVKIELPDHNQKCYTFYEIGNLKPDYVQANGDITIINWNTQGYPDSSVSIEETDSVYFQINKLEEKPAQWKIIRVKDKAYRPTCTFHLKANLVSPVVDIKVKTLFKANFITESIDGKQYELENGKVLSYDKIADYSILVSNDNSQDVRMSFSYISKGDVLETRTRIVKCDKTIHQLADYQDTIDELIENRSHLHGLITTDRKLEIKIGDNRTYYLSRYQCEMEIRGNVVILNPWPLRPCHLFAIPLVDPDDVYPGNFMMEISSLRLILRENEFILPTIPGHNKYLLYSAKRDNERAIPKLLDTTQSLNSYQRKELKSVNIDAWANALKEENCTEREGCWDRCAKYFMLANEESLHYSAFNCMNAVMTNDLLLAKFIVHMILVDNGNSHIYNYLKSLEHEFIFSSFWISKFSWMKVIQEVFLKMWPGAFLENGHLKSKPTSPSDNNLDDVKKKKDDYILKWQPNIHEVRRALFSSAMRDGLDLFEQLVTPNTHTRTLSQKVYKNYKEDVINDRFLIDLPYRNDICFPLEKDYSDLTIQISDHRAQQYLIAAMYLAEVLYGMHEEIWKDENYRLRKQLIRCQNYHSEVFSELVCATMCIIKRKLN